MMYADYAFYQSAFFGDQIEEHEFPKLSIRASAFLDYCTMNRAKNHTDMGALKMACCALAEQYQAIETAKKTAQKSLSASADGTEGELSSQSVGGWSKSYRSGGDSAKAALSAAGEAQETLYNIALMYLGNTGLLRARGYYA